MFTVFDSRSLIKFSKDRVHGLRVLRSRSSINRNAEPDVHISEVRSSQHKKSLKYENIIYFNSFVFKILVSTKEDAAVHLQLKSACKMMLYEIFKPILNTNKHLIQFMECLASYECFFLLLLSKYIITRGFLNMSAFKKAIR